MQKSFRKKNVLMRSGKKKKKATVSIHRARHRSFRKRLIAYLQHIERTELLKKIHQANYDQIHKTAN